jgi:hypothetical protein
MRHQFMRGLNQFGSGKMALSPPAHTQVTQGVRPVYCKPYSTFIDKLEVVEICYD